MARYMNYVTECQDPRVQDLIDSVGGQVASKLECGYLELHPVVTNYALIAVAMVWRTVSPVGPKGTLEMNYVVPTNLLWHAVSPRMVVNVAADALYEQYDRHVESVVG